MNQEILQNIYEKSINECQNELIIKKYMIVLRTGYKDVNKEKQELPCLLEHLISYHLQKKYGYCSSSVGFHYTVFNIEMKIRVSDEKNALCKFKKEFFDYIDNFIIDEQALETEKAIQYPLHNGY